MKYIRIVNYLKDRQFNNLDLSMFIIFTILSLIFILIPPYNQTFLRIIFALPLLLFLPGYMLIAAMFPRRGELSTIERFTLSIGLSIAITVFDGFGLNYTRWGFRPNSITISLSIIIGILFLITIIQRWRYETESYNFSLGNIRSLYDFLITKETETRPNYDPALEKMLIKTMIIAILIVTAMLIYAKVTFEPEKFTTLYILGADGKAENYLTKVSVGEPSTILVGVENYEYFPVNYTLVVTLGGITLTKEEIHLDHEGKWVNNVTFIPQLTGSIAFAGANKSKLEFQLLKDNMTYRSVHLLLNTNLDSVKFAQLPQILNGDMESNESWDFSESSPGITGGYNKTTNFSSRAYEINFTSNARGSYGRISQNFTINGSARAVLSFDIKDSLSNSSNYTYKQALLEDKVIWESEAGIKNNSWEHVEVPVFVSHSGTFSLGIFGRSMSHDKVTVWIDNVYLIPYGPKGKEVKIIPARKVYDFNLDIMGEPRKLEKNMKIDGFNFPGFEYNLDENRSYEELILNISGLNETNLTVIDTGNATYITKVNGSEVKLMGSRFKILGKDLPTNLSRKIEIPSTRIIKLDESFQFWGDYSLYLNLITSRDDAAMITLKKGGITLESRFVGRGIYEYWENVGQFRYVVFRTKVESIIGDSVNFTDMELYSDEITELKLNDFYGDFEVVNISSDEIVFENSYPIELKDKTTILKGTAGFRISGDRLYPYTSNVQVKGTPQYINSGMWMNITGFNYPGFTFENDVSNEDLCIYFTGAGNVKEGDATYVSKVHNGKISFLGNSYELIQPSRPGYITNIKTERLLIMRENETKLFDGYNFNIRKIDNNIFQLRIRKINSDGQQRILERALDFNKSIYSDINYFMLTGKDNYLTKSNILGAGDTFEYWEEFKVDHDYKKITGRLDHINSSNASNISFEFSVRFYEVPFEILPGKIYGDFEVYSISNNSIILKNTKPLLFGQGTEVPLLGGVMKIKTSAHEFLAYPEK